MPDIFSIPDQVFGKSFSADGARVSFSGGDSVAGSGLLTTQIGVNYSQSVTRIYELGTNTSYYFRGRAEGRARLNRVLGPRPIVAGFYAAYGNVCQAAENNLQFAVATGCNNDTLSQASFEMRNVVITNFGLTTESQQVLINEELQMLFIGLFLT